MAKTNQNLTVKELAARTPATRNRYIDFLRVLSIFVVVIGHWLMAVITIDASGAIQGDNILGLVPWMQYVTWGLQVMPIFFIVGGFANAASWTSAQARGVTYADWVRSRMRRLLRPTLAFVAVWTALTVLLAHLVRLSPETLEAGLTLVAVPVWFLGVYLLVIPLVPVMLRLHERFRIGVPLVLITLAAFVDLMVRDFGLGGFGYVNYLFVWVAVHQLGFFWRDGRLAGRARAVVVGAFGLVALLVLSGAGLYSRSMLGVPGEEFGNTQPPTIMLMAVGLFQLGIILLLEEPARRWLQRERVWAPVIAANGLAMTVYLWHLPAMAFGVLIAMSSGFGLRGEPLTATWWATRPVWIASLALITLLLVLVFQRVERSGGAPAASGGGAVAPVAGSLATAVGLGLLALDGFYRADGYLAVAVTPLVLLVGGWLLLAGGRFRDLSA